jgi:hypothetical protein
MMTEHDICVISADTAADTSLWIIDIHVFGTQT